MKRFKQVGDVIARSMLAVSFLIALMVQPALSAILTEKIVFSKMEPSGYYDLWMMSPDGSNLQRLTDDAVNGISSTIPTVFPDGRSILYQRGYNIAKLNLATLQIFMLTTDGVYGNYAYSMPHLSSDGSKIAYSYGQAIGGSCSACTTYEIYIMNADGSNKVRVTTNSYRDGEALFSPDGTKLLLTHYEGSPASDCCNQTDAYLLNLSDSTETLLRGTTGYNWGIDFSSTGILIREDDPTYAISFVQPDGTGFRRIFDSSQQVVNAYFSPDGTKLLYLSNINGTYDAYISDTYGNNAVRLTIGMSIADATWGKVSQVAVAYIKNNDIYVTDELGTSSVNLTNTPTTVKLLPRFSPDGSKIAFYSSSSGRYELWTIHSDGSNQQQITSNHTPYQAYGDGGPVWASDGQSIYFGSAAPGDGEVWKIKLDGSDLIQLTNVSGYNTQSFDINRDGTWAIFDRGIQGQGNTNQLYMCYPDFTNEVVIQSNGAPHRSRFSPDGQSTAYTAATGTQPGTHIINVNGSVDQFITGDIHSDWHPDGSKLLVHEADALYWVNTDGTNKTLLTSGTWMASATAGGNNAIFPAISILKTGTGAGTVVSTPVGLDCGSNCIASFPTGTTVALNTTPNAGSAFAGWSGDPDCTDGFVTMNAGKICTATFTLLPASAVAISASPASPQFLGAPVTFSAAASGGTGSYQYKYLYRLSTAPTWSVAQAYSSSHTWTWSTGGMAAGSYQIQVWARNEGSTAAYEAVKTVGFTLKSTAATGVTLSAGPASPRTVGTPVTFTALGSGGTGSYEYKFIYKLSTAPTWSTGRAYSTSNTWGWTTGSLPAGSYTIQVWVRSIGSTANYEVVKTTGYTLKAPPATGVTITPDQVSPQLVGAGITFSAFGSGGSGTYQYQFLYKKSTDPTWSTGQGYLSSSSWLWETGSLTAGSYLIQVRVRNAGSTAAYEVIKTVGYTLQ